MMNALCFWVCGRPSWHRRFYLEDFSMSFLGDRRNTQCIRVSEPQSFLEADWGTVFLSVSAPPPRKPR